MKTYEEVRNRYCEPGRVPKIDARFREEVVRALRSTVFHGITGPIDFGSDGQNVGNRLSYCRFDPIDHEWRMVEYDSLVEGLGGE